MIQFAGQSIFNGRFVKIAADNEKAEYKLHKTVQIGTKDQKKVINNFIEWFRDQYARTEFEYPNDSEGYDLLRRLICRGDSLCIAIENAKTIVIDEIKKKRAFRIIGRYYSENFCPN